MEVKDRIQKKYEAEMEEFRSLGDCNLLESIFDEMKKHMEEEINEELRVLEVKKRQELKKIRMKI